MSCKAIWFSWFAKKTHPETIKDAEKVQNKVPFTKISQDYKKMENKRRNQKRKQKSKAKARE